jgi:FdhE protein
MADQSALQPDPSLIGGVPQAPFVRLPDPASLFARRAARFRALASSERLSGYLEFLAGIAEAQAAVQVQLPEPAHPDPAQLARAREFAMPPLDRTRVSSNEDLQETWAGLLGRLDAVPKPQAASAALARVRGLAPDAAAAMLQALAGGAAPDGDPAEHVYAAAVLEVHFTRLAAALLAAALVPVGVGACPACGGPPAVSLIAGWPGAEGARYACCALCSTHWNEVRVKCLVCGSTKGIGYQEIAGRDGTVKAETCDACDSYIKVLYHQKDMAIDPLADDVASLGLDQLLRGGRYRRAGANPYLVGY